MTYGMQISASGAQAAMFRQDSITANLANLGTVGFKPVMASAVHREHVRAEDNLWNMPSDTLLEQLGGGVFSGRTVVNFKQGALETTGNPLDLAVQGEGFFTVGDGANPALTRDGRFTLDSNNRIVMSTSGLPLLDDAGDEIEVDPALGPLNINGNGAIEQSGAIIATVGLADVPDRSSLIKVGGGLFADQSGQPLGLTPATGMIRQNMVESSAVDEIGAMMQISAASKSAQSNIGMIDMQNRMLDRLVNTYARLS
ncbi:MAG: flagellar hook-basal body protein [Phycisphaerales bacterium]